MKILGLVVLHIWALHVPGNNNPIGIDLKKVSLKRKIKNDD